MLLYASLCIAAAAAAETGIAALYALRLADAGHAPGIAAVAALLPMTIGSIVLALTGVLVWSREEQSNPAPWRHALRGAAASATLLNAGVAAYTIPAGRDAYMPFALAAAPAILLAIYPAILTRKPNISS